MNITYEVISDIEVEDCRDLCNELKRKIDGITNMMLSQVLKEMEGYGLVSRKQYMEIPPRVEYSLTQEGKDLIPALISLAKWGKMMKNNSRTL